MKFFKSLIGLYFLTLFVEAAFFFPFLIVSAEDLETKCQQVAESETPCPGMSGTDCRKLLEDCAQFYEEESKRIEQDLTKTEKEKKNLQSQLSTLNNKIKNLEYQIKQGNLMIKDLTIQIAETMSSIDKISLKINESQTQLTNILRTIYEEDKKQSLEILLEGNLSDFFDNLVYLERLNSRVSEILASTKNLKNYLEKQKQKIDEEKDSVEKMVRIQSLQKQESETIKNEREKLLKLTKEEYQKQLKEKEETVKRVSAIRARIFELIGVPKAPTFGEAYEMAKYVSSITGVRPAFLLAVLTQESNLGKNVGQCYLTNINTGAGKRIKDNAVVSRVMSPTRDVPYFLDITNKLGRDYSFTPVSCPMSYGWGGAMGPAQFIPSTWIKYENRISAITGKLSDPWNIKDAFIAAGLYLADYGASAKTENAEWKAAMIYFSGTTNTTYRFYGNSVISLARQYQKDINELEKGL